MRPFRLWPFTSSVGIEEMSSAGLASPFLLALAVSSERGGGGVPNIPERSLGCLTRRRWRPWGERPARKNASGVGGEPGVVGTGEGGSLSSDEMSDSCLLLIRRGRGRGVERSFLSSSTQVSREFLLLAPSLSSLPVLSKDAATANWLQRRSVASVDLAIEEKG